MALSGMFSSNLTRRMGLTKDLSALLYVPVREFLRTGDIPKFVTTCAPLLNYTPHLLRKLNIILSQTHIGSKLVVIQASSSQAQEDPQYALLAVVITADRGELIQFGGHPIRSAITNTESLRHALNSREFHGHMERLSKPLIMAVMELLLVEIGLQVNSNLKLCKQYLRGLSKQHGILPPSFLIYEVEREGEFPVNNGGFADVYKGRLDQEVVCLKVLRYFTSCTAADRQKLVKNFCREALVWKQLDHPNILPFLGVAADLFYPSFCLVSPWMYNGNINDFLQQNPDHDRSKAIVEIAEAIDYLHGYDPPIVHADIRGANVLVAHDFRCCLADFGLAGVVESQPLTSTTRSSHGALRWMAPEYLQPDSPGAAQPPRDIYAFGCTVLEIFTGKPPFHYLQELAVLNQISSGKHPRRDDFPSDSDTLWSLLKNCWHKNPTRRPSAATVLHHLRSITASSDGAPSTVKFSGFSLALPKLKAVVSSTAASVLSETKQDRRGFLSLFKGNTPSKGEEDRKDGTTSMDDMLTPRPSAAAGYPSETLKTGSEKHSLPNVFPRIRPIPIQNRPPSIPSSYRNPDLPPEGFIPTMPIILPSPHEWSMPVFHPEESGSKLALDLHRHAGNDRERQPTRSGGRIHAVSSVSQFDLGLSWGAETGGLRGARRIRRDKS